MLTIRPTKMLAKRLGIELPTALPVVSNRVADWCAHEFKEGRDRYLMFCNTASLYPVVMMSRGVTDGQGLVERLLGGLHTCLRGGPLEIQFQQRILTEAPEVQWSLIPGRSVLGSMNDLILMAKYRLEDRDESPAELSRRLAQTPMSMLGMNSPDRVFASLSGGKIAPSGDR